MDNKITITICGDGGCGKSSMTLRIVRGQWTHEYDPTIEDSYSVTRIVDGTTYNLAITDTAGQEEYRGMWSASNMSSDAFLVVYDITSPASLDQCADFDALIQAEYRDRLEAGKCWPALVLAGNKCDLQSSREISAKQGLDWARQRGYVFMETSAREMVNIEETVASLIRRVVDARAMHANGELPVQPLSPVSDSSRKTFDTSDDKERSRASSPHLWRRPGPDKRTKNWWAMAKCWSCGADDDDKERRMRLSHS